jgi:hypothetical protein
MTLFDRSHWDRVYRAKMACRYTPRHKVMELDPEGRAEHLSQNEIIDHVLYAVSSANYALKYGCFAPVRKIIRTLYGILSQLRCNRSNYETIRDRIVREFVYDKLTSLKSSLRLVSAILP